MDTFVFNCISNSNSLTISSDGWTDEISNLAVVNVVAITTEGAIFIESVHTKDKRHTGMHTCNIYLLVLNNLHFYFNDITINIKR